MKRFLFYFLTLTIWDKTVGQTVVYQNDLNYRVEAGSRMCFFEKGKAGQIMEVQYQVIDGQHGDLDISVDIIDPNGTKLLEDYKESENSLIKELEVDGEYVFCLDNSFSMMNSKLVYVYVLIGDKETDYDENHENEAVVTVQKEGEGGNIEHNKTTEKDVLEWTGTDENGKQYLMQVAKIEESLKRMLRHVVRARHLLDLYGASRSRDSYLAMEDTFIVDAWSAFQITFMVIVGMVQVYSIKKLFSRSDRTSTFF